MKLCGSSEKRITKEKNDENVPQLEVTEVVLVDCNIVINIYQHDSRVKYTVTQKTIWELNCYFVPTFILLEKI